MTRPQGSTICRFLLIFDLWMSCPYRSTIGRLYYLRVNQSIQKKFIASCSTHLFPHLLLVVAFIVTQHFFFQACSIYGYLSDESYNKRRCIRLSNKDVKETKVQIRKPLAHLFKSKCHKYLPSLPSWSKENLKTGKIFLLSSQPDSQKCPSYH